MKRIKQTGLDQVGGKAYHLLKMQAAGLPIPDFAVFVFDFFQKSASSADLERWKQPIGLESWTCPKSVSSSRTGLKSSFRKKI